MNSPSEKPDTGLTYRRVAKNGIDWIVDTTCGPLIPDVLLKTLLHPGASDAGQVIRENKVRRSMVIRLPQAREAIFAKLYKQPTGLERCKYFLFPSKASSEWKSMIKLFTRGLPVARPLARGEKRRLRFLREAYLFTRALENATPLSGLAAGNRASINKNELLENAAQLVSAIHKQGFFFRDLHAGNILLVPQQDQSQRLYLVDFHKAWHTRWVPLWMRVRDLAQLRNSLSASPADQWRFLMHYISQSNLPAACLRDVARRVDLKAKRMWNTHLKSRTRRCLKESTEFSIIADKQCTLYRQKSYPEGLIQTVLRNYEQHSSQQMQAILKKTPKETVSCMSASYGGKEYKVVVKESIFSALTSRIRYTIFPSRPKRNWIGARALRVRGIPTPDAMALIEYTSKVMIRKSLLLTAYIDGAHELNDYVLMRYGKGLSSSESHQKNIFIAALAGLIRDMHEKGVYHADLKSNNILVCEEGETWKFYVIDLDRISCTSPLTFRERANNLAQINASVAGCITPADRILFFKVYAQGSPAIKQLKKYFTLIMDISRKKYTTPYGLIFPEHRKRAI